MYHAADDLKERVRDATDIVALLGSYLQLIPRGRQYVALCPFHDDSRPSLTVNPERQTWKCWPCDAGGDVFSWVMRRENVDFPAAMRILAERAGIELTTTGKRTEPGSPNDKATLYKAMAWAEQQFHHFFLEAREAEAARQYVAERAIEPASIEKFRIGYAPDEWSWLIDRAADTAYSPAVLDAVGLVIQNDQGRRYDRFRGRVLFPIRDAQDRPIAVGGRILPQIAELQAQKHDGRKPAKYINSPETRLYSKSDQLYALNIGREQLAEQAKQKRVRNAIVMEGYTDVVIASQFGVECPLAVCGTALGARHLNLLRRFADRVTLVLDGDEAGQRRAADVLQLFVAGQMELRIVTLPDNLDPADYVVQHGVAAFNQIVETSPDALDFCVDKETAGIDLANETLRATPALQRILGVMAKAPRPQADTPAVFRLREQQTISRLARMFRVEESTVRQSLSEQRDKSKPQIEPSPQQQSPRLQLHGWERELFMLLIRNPDAIARVIEKISPEQMRTETGRAFLLLYQDLEVEGKIPDFGCVMDALQEEGTKNLFVGLAEEADRLRADDPTAQLNDLLARFESKRQEQSRRQQIAELESGKLKEDEELELLNKLFESKKLEL